MLGGEGEGEVEVEVEGVEGRADQVRVGMLKSQVSFSGEEEGEGSPEQMMRLPWGSCGEGALAAIREGSLAMVEVSCSL